MNNMKNEDVVISSRVRFARNLKDVPFSAKGIESAVVKVKDAIGDKFAQCDFDAFSDTEKQSYVEKHIVSREFMQSKTPHALFSDKDGVLRIMAGEEDHVRIQAITRGFSLDEAYNAACEADDLLSSKLDIAYDEKLGFLTRCPTNLGTGMRASVMVFLPGLTLAKRIRPLLSQLAKLGIAVRGIYGEGSEAQGCIYQISNRETLGITEEDTIAKISEITSQVITLERKAREELKDALGDRLIDRVMRSLGKLKYAHMLSLSEFMECWADIRMGASIGIVKELDYTSLDTAFAKVMPGTLSARSGLEQNEGALALERAKRVKELI